MTFPGIAAGGCYRPDSKIGLPDLETPARGGPANHQMPPSGEGSYSMPGGANVELKDGKLSVNGGRGGDDIDVQKLANGNYAVNVNGKSMEFDGCKVQELDINAGRGSDRVNVGAGVDAKTSIDGGRGNDLIANQAKDAFIRGGRGHDQIFNSGQGARIHGGRGNDTIANTGAHAQVNGGRGADQLFNAGAFAQVNGGRGRDNIANTGAFTRLNGGRGNDQVFNAGFAALVRGGLGNDSLVNRGAFSQVAGGRGHDTLVNDGFASRLDGGRGFDSELDLSRLRGIGRDAICGGGRDFQRFDLAALFQQSLSFLLL